MEKDRMPRPGEIYNHFKDKLYQIITVATNTETGEPMVVYQALYGDFRTYVRPLEMFLNEVDHNKYPEIKQKYRFELRTMEVREQVETPTQREEETTKRLDLSEHLNESTLFNDRAPLNESAPEGTVNVILLKFLDAESYSRKLDVLTSNRKHLNDRLINDMAVSLDCAVNEGPLDERIQGLIYCLQAMCRFEDRRLR